MVARNEPRGGWPNNRPNAAENSIHHDYTSGSLEVLPNRIKLATDVVEIKVHRSSQHPNRFLVLSYAFLDEDRGLGHGALGRISKAWRQYVLARGEAMLGAESIMEVSVGEFDLLATDLAWLDFAIRAAEVILSPENHEQMDPDVEPQDTDAWFYGLESAEEILRNEEGLRARSMDRAQRTGGQDASSTS